jgi:CheY-like chemotaxis protein
MSDTKTILLVEDEDLLVILQTEWLERLGFNVIAVSSGEKAIEVVQTTPGIDLILMDINLGPGMDGTEAASRILKDHDMPVVFLSSHEGEEIAERTKEIASYGYVVKDGDMSALRDSVKMTLKLHEARRVPKKKAGG